MAEGTPNLQGRFLLRKKLGQGGMAEVWRAYDSRLGVWRAVKILLPEYARKSKLRQRFESEARAMALLEHPNIVRVYDVGSEGGQTWIVMELCEGGTLEGWLGRHGAMPPRLAVEVILQVAAGIAHAHAHGVIHRDVKPQNVLITEKGTAKLTDFGIAQFEDTSLTRTGSFMGTLGYMAPEQRSDAKKVDRRTDIYAVGATLFTLLTARIEMDLFAAAQDPALFGEIPSALAPLIGKAVAYHRDERYPTAEEFIAACNEVIGSLPAPPPGQPRLNDRPRTPRSAPSVVEQALAEAKRSPSADEPVLPGETVLPSYDLFDGSSIPPSLRMAAEAQRTATPAPPNIARPRPSTPHSEEPSYVVEDPPRDTPSRRELPWVPSAQRRTEREEKPFDFESLYVQSGSDVDTEVPAPLRSFQSDPPAEARVTEQEDAPVTPPEDVTPTPIVPPPRWRRSKESTRRSPWRALNETLDDRFGVSLSPLTLVLIAIFLLIVSGALASLHGATSLVGAKTATRAHLKGFTALVERQAPPLIDDLAWAGADDAQLKVQWERYRLAWSPERQLTEGHALLLLIESQVESIEQRVQPSGTADPETLRRKLRAMQDAYDAYERSRLEWARLAERPTAGLAVRVGLADQPPPKDGR